ncbi:aldo/keto reductase [Spirochaetia bacterium 38H-sp]|uniref:Aldo/keto reductase n=1 Tax=Rarispira pelagica TaxID=3141764 RepID=A0ABU9UCJ7_9SPIR
MKRTLGRSDIEVSALGLGCWPIGGLAWRDGKPDGYHGADDNVSIDAINAAIDNGINFFDTADCYGAGHAEEVLGKAIKGKRDKVVIATKFGNIFNESTRTLAGESVSPDYIRRALEASLRRLGTDYIDIYQIHTWSMNLAYVTPCMDTLDELVREGKIRTYGWSTDLLEGAMLVAARPMASVMQYQCNLFFYDELMMEYCKKNNLAGLNRSPLAMGLLSGKYRPDTRMPEDDIRGHRIEWMTFYKDGKPNAELVKKLDSIKEILTDKGRSLVQGAIAWLWAKSPVNIPIPGFRTREQAIELAKSMEYGPLSKEALSEIDKLLDR